MLIYVIYFIYLFKLLFFEEEKSLLYFLCACVCLFPGSLFPTSMRIDEQGRLVVNFHTRTYFRGLFVESHSSGTNW